MSSSIKALIETYPPEIAQTVLQIRELIFEISQEKGLGEITETLKWGEPSYLAKTGSTVRLAWKPRSPAQFGIYFNCQSRLIETFRLIFPADFVYQGNRALIFAADQEIPWSQLRVCLAMALRYHQIKHLPLLGFEAGEV